MPRWTRGSTSWTPQTSTARRSPRSSWDAAPRRESETPAEPPAPEVIDWLRTRTRSAETVAATAIAGLERDLFVIPTHPHIEDDVAERYGEIQRGLQALRDFDAGK